MQYQTVTPPAPCVGRESELARLNDLYREAQQRGERLALLEGPSGVGKSHILGEFRSRVRLEGGVVLEGRCEPGRAFGPFAEIVDRALRFLEETGRTTSIDLGHLACRGACHRFWYQHHGRDAAEGAAPAVLAVHAAELEALEKELRFFDALHQLLRDVAAVRAPVVLLHDLERADQGTLQLMSFMLEGAGPWSDGVAPDRSLRALFMASLRSDGMFPHGDSVDKLREHACATRIEVGHLDEEGVRAYLQSPDTVARVLQRTGGMPERIDLLLDGDPLTPQARVARRIEALSDPARALVEALAVVEHPADYELLSRIAGTTVDHAARHEFADLDLVTRSVVDGSLLFAFAREADRERAHQILGPERSRRLHARCVEAYLDLPGREQDAAHHALEAGDLEQAVPLALDAARSLAARHAHGEAAALLEQVREQAPDGAPLELREQLADLYRAAGDYKHALSHARTVLEATPASATAARRLGELLTLAGQLDDATRALENARRLAASTDDPSAVVEVEVLLAELHYQRASYDEALPWADEALAAALELGQGVLEISARNTLGKLALAQKDAATAAELFESNRKKAAQAGLRHHEAQALTNLGVAMLRRQQLADAEAAFRRAIEVASNVGDTRERAIATENLAVLAHLRRDYRRAQPYYHEAVGLLKRLGNRPMLARVAINLGELYLSLGEHARARTLCEFAAHVGGAGLPPSVTGEGLVLRGRIELADDNTSAARTSFEGALRIYRRLGEARVADAMLELARVGLADGDVAAARAVLADMPAQESPKRQAEIALLAVDVERAAGGETLTAAKRALDAAQQADDQEIVLPAVIRVGRALIDEGDLSGAADALERASRIEEELTRHIPEESLGPWSARPLRAELTDLDARLTAAWTEDGREASPRRPSSMPPPAPKTSLEERAAHWAEAYPNIVGGSPRIHGIPIVPPFPPDKGQQSRSAFII